MNIDDYILSELSDGPKGWTDLKREIVPKICAKGTLSKHLRILEEDEKIRKVLNDDRTTTYSLMPKSIECGRSAKDVITLESLIKNLGWKTRKDLQLENVKSTEEKWWNDRYRIIGPTKNHPKMNFRLQLDENTLRVVKFVYSPSKLANELKETIRKKLNEIKLKMPSTIKNEIREFTYNPMNWNDVSEFSRKAALKHGLRFLVFSWYDGKDYKEKILSANEKLQKLEKGHEEYISILDEINRRCYFSGLEYYYEVPAVFEEVLMDEILKISNPYQLIRNAFLFHLGNWELMALESALVSEAVTSKLPKTILKRELNRGLNKIKSPYEIISFDEYLKMKISMINIEDKKALVKNLLDAFYQFLRSYGKDFSRDYREHPEDYHRVIDLLIDKLEINDDLSKTPNKLPILNFIFNHNNNEVDFSNEALVKNFLTFLSKPKKKKWLSKCLSLGLPIFPNIPFEKLGLEKKNIL